MTRSGCEESKYIAITYLAKYIVTSSCTKINAFTLMLSKWDLSNKYMAHIWPRTGNAGYLP